MTLSLENRRLVLLSSFAALSLVFSYIESIVFAALPLPVPGIKLGLANIIVLYTLYKFGVADASAVMLVKTLLSFLLFGNVTAFYYSAAGGVMTLISCTLTRRFLRHVSFAAPSAISAVAFNIGQSVIALFLVGDAFLYYIPLLLLSGVVTGTITGILLNIVDSKISIQLKRALKGKKHQ